MNDASQQLQDKIKIITEKFDELRLTAQELEDIYWKGSVNTDISALGASDPVCKAAKLTKTEATNALSLAEAVRKFFNNTAVATADRKTIIHATLNGDADLVTAISSDLEAFGDKAVVFCNDLQSMFKAADDADDYYTGSEISAALGGMSAHTVLFGCDATKDDITSAITMLQQYQNLISNAAVTTGDYKTTLNKWERIK